MQPFIWIFAIIPVVVIVLFLTVKMTKKIKQTNPSKKKSNPAGNEVPEQIGCTFDE